MLGDQEAGIGVDLWALGCVVYQMLVGRPPFQGMSQYLIFEQIREARISFPEGIDADGMDLVRKLLVQEPERRLGGGETGTENDLAALKLHPFIRDFDIENILNVLVPFVDWPVVQKRGSDDDPDDEEDDDDLEVKLLNMKGEEVKVSQASSEPTILVSGILKKKCGWFYKKRYLIVSDQPRIYYTDADNSQKIREIVVSKELKAEIKAGKDFMVNNHQRTYYFREMVGNPQRWVDAINKVIKDHFS